MPETFEAMVSVFKFQAMCILKEGMLTSDLNSVFRENLAEKLYEL